jgi:molybdenum cofactor cytidylyltransferase
MPRETEAARVDASPDDQTSLRIAGIVLGAGASRRMGGSINKLLLPIEGEPMVRCAVRQATEARLEPIVVVTGHEPDRVAMALEGLDCTFVQNPDYTGPTSTSLHAALRSLDDSISAALVMLGDMVRVTSDMVHAVADAARTSGAPLVVSRYGDDGVLAPPLLFCRALWPELLAWTGEGCGKSVAKAHLHEAFVLDWPAESLFDVDTPEDYGAIR